MSDDGRTPWPARLAIALFALIVLLIGLDLTADYTEGAGWIHMLIELLVLLFAAGGIVVLWRELGQVRSDLLEARGEAEAWRRENRELVRGLGAAIRTQFAGWQLSPAEAEVGLLLLKGLSHKEIAALRETSERTIREQARALYRKSGLSGRSALAAFFLEDLLLPVVDEGPC